MGRVVLCSAVALAFALLACGQEASVPDSSSNSEQQLQTKKDGTATGDGSLCSWNGTVAADTCGTTVPGSYKLGEEFRSILDQCNDCTCTAKGIMCTVRICSPDEEPPVTPPPGDVDPVPPIGGNPPPSPPPGGGVCPALHRVCKGDAPPLADENGCLTRCPEDGNVYRACDDLARICKDGSAAKQAPDSCALLCPEDGVQPGK